MQSDVQLYIWGWIIVSQGLVGPGDLLNLDLIDKL